MRERATHQQGLGTRFELDQRATAQIAGGCGDVSDIDDGAAVNLPETLRIELIAQFTQDVVGAAAELAGDREAGAVVVDPACDLEVIVVVRRAAARRLVGGLEQRPTQQLGTLV